MFAFYTALPGQFLAQPCFENVHRILVLESCGEAVFNVIPMQYKSALLYLSEHRQEALLYLGGWFSPMIKHGAQQLTF